MQLLKIGDRLDGGVVVSITKHGVLTRRKKYERLYPLDAATGMAKQAWQKKRVQVTTKKEM